MCPRIRSSWSQPQRDCRSAGAIGKVCDIDHEEADAKYMSEKSFRLSKEKSSGWRSLLPSPPTERVSRRYMQSRCTQIKNTTPGLEEIIIFTDERFSRTIAP
jgi:hypothetical protein